jgi:lipopolysaccharide/colanic/teichoic acid biosynthesis glycosyltransferase
MVTDERALATVLGVRPTPGVPPSRARRALDIVVALLGLAVAALPLLALMLAVRLTSPGPALFRQIRLGQGGRPFVLVKLRSMRVNSSGPDITPAGDPRVTPLGRVLRATSLDELPQLWQVLRGQMTLVGPRPETPRLAAGYPPECRWVFSVRPGLTGPTQVRLRDGDVLPPGVPADTQAYLARLVPARTAVDATFLARPTLWATLGVLLDTVRYLLGFPVPPVIPGPASGRPPARGAATRRRARGAATPGRHRVSGRPAPPDGSSSARTGR